MGKSSFTNRSSSNAKPDENCGYEYKNSEEYKQVRSWYDSYLSVLYWEEIMFETEYDDNGDAVDEPEDYDARAREAMEQFDLDYKEYYLQKKKENDRK